MLHFGEVTVETGEEQRVFEVQLYLGDLDHDAVRVELYADGTKGGPAVRQEMICVRQLAAVHGCVYRAAVSAIRSATDYTARVIPHCSGVAVPLEATHILWQR
jgi:glycogen phosphorylase